MATLLKSFLVREELLKRRLHIVSSLDFSRIFQSSRHQTKHFLEKGTREGLFVRLKKGLYALKTDLPTEQEIANRLYQPSYISFEYALAFYNILPEMVYQVTNATTKPTRVFTLSDKVFSYFKIKDKAYAGYHFVEKEGMRFLIAEPEKAVADYFYFVALGKKPGNDRLDLSFLNKKKLLEYAELYERKKLVDLVKKII